MKTKILSLFLMLFVVPSFVFASWWNPFSWKVFQKKQVVPQEIQVSNTEKEKTSEEKIAELQKQLDALKNEQKISTEGSDIKNNQSSNSTEVKKTKSKKQTLPTKSTTENILDIGQFTADIPKIITMAENKKWTEFKIKSSETIDVYKRYHDGLIWVKNPESAQFVIYNKNSGEWSIQEDNSNTTQSTIPQTNTALPKTNNEEITAILNNYLKQTTNYADSIKKIEEEKKKLEEQKIQERTEIENNPYISNGLRMRKLDNLEKKYESLIGNLYGGYSSPSSTRSYGSEIWDISPNIMGGYNISNGSKIWTATPNVMGGWTIY